MALGITDLRPSLGSATDYRDSGQLDHVLTPLPPLSWLPNPPHLIVLSGFVLLLCLCCRFKLIYLEITYWDHATLRPKPTSLPSTDSVKTMYPHELVHLVI